MARPEIELLLSCCRSQIDCSTEERIKLLLQQGIDWTYVIQTSARHRVMPLLYRNLKSTCPELVPRVILSQLKTNYEANALRNLILTKELLRLLSLFDECGISVIPFKGPILASSLYGDLALRQFSDIDILINPKDKNRAMTLLTTDRYKLISDGWQQTFIHRQKPWIEVDLHWQLTNSKFPYMHPDYETLWNRSRLSDLCGKSVVNFSTNDSLIILALQVARGGFEENENLAQICDLSQLISFEINLDWDKVLQDVRNLRVSRPFVLSLLLASNLLNTLLPAQAKQTMQQHIQIDPFILEYAVRFQKRLFSEYHNSLFSQLVFQRRFLRARSSSILYHFGCLWDYLGVITVGIMSINQTDRKFLPLPSSLTFLYLLIRPIRLVIKYSSSELGLVCNKSRRAKFISLLSFLYSK